jgi:hypothetical protein
LDWAEAISEAEALLAGAGAAFFAAAAAGVGVAGAAGVGAGVGAGFTAGVGAAAAGAALIVSAAFDFRERCVDVSVAVAATGALAVSAAFDFRVRFFVLVELSVAAAGACAKTLSVPNPITNAVAPAINLK